MWHVWENVDVPIGFRWGSLRERNHLEDLTHMKEGIRVDLKEILMIG
jgi:hypothetical protein